MAIALTTNHRPRKSLADQLDRLDTILDALSDGLNEAVRDTVAHAIQSVVRQAVQTAVSEVLTEVEIDRRRRMESPAAARATTIPGRIVGTVTRMAKSCWNGLVGAVRRACSFAVETANAAQRVAHSGAETAVRQLTAATLSTWFWLQVLSRLSVRLHRQLLLAIGTGVAAGGGTYLAGPAVAATVGGLSISLLTLAILGLQNARASVEAIHSIDS